MIFRHRFKAHFQQVLFDGFDIVQGIGNTVTDKTLPFFRWCQYMAGHNGEINHGFGMVFTLDLVRIQQFSCRFALNDHCHFPGQVKGITHTAIITLTLPYWHDVRSITGKQNSVDTEFVGNTGIMGINTLTDYFNTIRAW